MKEIIFKPIKWFIFVSFFVAGLGFLARVSEGNMHWAFLAIMSFGVVYWLSEIWKEMPLKTMVITIVFTAVMGVVAKFFPMIVYLATDTIIGQYPFLYWIALLFFPGIPIMYMVFKFLD